MSKMAKFILYADETNLFVSTKNIEVLMRIANTVLAKVGNRLEVNQLKLNSRKLYLLLFIEINDGCLLILMRN